MTDFEKRVSNITLAGMRVTGEDQSIQDFNDYLKNPDFKKLRLKILLKKSCPT